MARSQLQYPLDQESRRILREALRDILPPLLLELTWNSYVYINDHFEHIGGYNTGGAGSTVAVNSNGIILTTGSTTNNVAYASRPNSSTYDVFNMNKNQKFRVVVSVADVSDCEATFVVGETSLVGSSDIYYGFEIIDGAINGICENGGSQQTVNLNTTVGDTDVVRLEAHLVNQDARKRHIVFHVNGVQRGALSAEVPESQTALADLFNAHVKTTTSATRDFVVYNFEYIQEV